MGKKRMCTVSHTVPLPMGKFKRFEAGQKYDENDISHKYSVDIVGKKGAAAIDKVKAKAVPVEEKMAEPVKKVTEKKSTKSTTKQKKTIKKK